MENTIEILKQQANGYLMMAKALKEQGIEYKHYLVQAKTTAEEATKLQMKLEELEMMMVA